jgi:hypothetical protein
VGRDDAARQADLGADEAAVLVGGAEALRRVVLSEVAIDTTAIRSPRRTASSGSW